MFLKMRTVGGDLQETESMIQMLFFFQSVKKEFCPIRQDNV